MGVVKLVKLGIKNFFRLHLYCHEIRRTKASQILWRLYYYFMKIHVNMRIEGEPAMRPVMSPCVPFIPKDRVSIKSGIICLLNEEVPYSSMLWNDISREKLWVYNLHYFDGLISSDEQTVFNAFDLIEDWLLHTKFNRGYGYDGYTLSLRITNWIKFHLTKKPLPERYLRSLYFQTRLLNKKIEYHVLGNHLIANAKALIFSGLFFQTAEAEGWLEKGVALLGCELKVQVLSDGGHYELSPMYHALVIEELLDVCNIFIAYNRRIPKIWENLIVKMLYWLSVMVHPDGEVSYFNDSVVEGSAPRPEQLVGYIKALGVADFFPAKLPPGLHHLDETGYVRYEDERFTMLIDVGDTSPACVPGHSHADTLSFELSLFGSRFLVNTGVDRYGKTAHREYQRSTRAHNCVEVNGLSSSEVWGNFRLARAAKPCGLSFDHNEGVTRVECSHDGYQRSGMNIIHRRCWVFLEDSISIEDELGGKFKSAIGYLHLHPSVVITEVRHDKISLLVTNQEVKLIFSGPISLTDGNYCEGLGISQKNKIVKYKITKAKEPYRVIIDY